MFDFRICLLLLISSCHQPRKLQPKVADTVLLSKPVIQEDSLAFSRTVLKLIKHKSYDSLAQFIHPESGLRFSPQGWVVPGDKVLSKEAFLAALTSRLHFWGEAAGSGDSINLSMPDYFTKYVYDVDFANAPVLSLNTIHNTEGSLENMKKVYDPLVFSESYFPGFEKKYDGMDWRALRLVYQNYQGRTYLVGIIHAAWAP